MKLNLHKKFPHINYSTMKHLNKRQPVESRPLLLIKCKNVFIKCLKVYKENKKHDG